MSEIIKKADSDRELSHIIRTDSGNYFYIDSNNTFDAGYETMAFAYDMENDEVDSWADLYVKHYKSYEKMKKGHFYVCTHFEVLS